MRNKENYVLIVGSSNMDLNIYSKRFPKPGETVTGGTFRQSFGGKGANQAVASIRSGSNTCFIGKVGDDTFGPQMLENLTKEGVNSSGVIIDSKVASGVAIILIDSTGQNMISVAPGANSKLALEDLKDANKIIENATVVMLQMEIPMEVIRDIFNKASRNNAITILNPAPFKEIPLEVLKQISIITPNENELFQLHSSLRFNEHEKDISKVANDLYGCGINSIIVTLGDKGCFVSEGNNGQQFHVSAIKVNDRSLALTKP